MIDASGAVVFWNAAAEQLFGLERSRAIGQELASLIFPDHLQTAVRAVLLREVDEPGDELSQRQIELGARRADGREIPVDIATTPIELAATRFLAIHLRDASERSERERELHSDARRRSAVLDLGQVALEGMALEQLLQRAVALSIDELGVDRCEVWKRDEGGETLTLRANVGWPEAEAGTQVPLATATQPGYTLLRGQGAIVVEDFRREGRFGSIGPIDAPPAQSSISIRIPGTSGRFRIARRRLREPAPLRAQRHQPLRLARADARRGDRALPGDRFARPRRAADPPADRAAALDHLSGGARPRRGVGFHLAPGRGDHRLLGRGVDGRSEPLGPDRASRRPRAGHRGRERLCAREPSARHRLPDPQAGRRDDLGPGPGLHRRGRRARRDDRRGPDHRHQRAASGRGSAPLPGRVRRPDGPDEPAQLRGSRRRGDRNQPPGRARSDGDHRPRSPDPGQRHARAQHGRSGPRRHREDARRRPRQRPAPGPPRQRRVRDPDPGGRRGAGPRAGRQPARDHPGAHRHGRT